MTQRVPFRQGDVLLVPTTEDTRDYRPVPRDRGRVVLAYGEVTGHAHVVVGDDIELMAADALAEVDRILQVGRGGATVVHEEHGAITLDPGQYRVIRQVEHSDADEPVLVRD